MVGETIVRRTKERTEGRNKRNEPKKDQPSEKTVECAREEYGGGANEMTKRRCGGRRDDRRNVL
eukprot:jgi/Psemu1/59715/gm1.59715_g